MNWKRWIELAIAFAATLAGLLAGAVLAFFQTYDMSSGLPPPGSHRFDLFWWLLFPGMGGLPGLCWAVSILREKRGENS